MQAKVGPLLVFGLAPASPAVGGTGAHLASSSLFLVALNLFHTTQSTPSPHVLLILFCDNYRHAFHESQKWRRISNARPSPWFNSLCLSLAEFLFLVLSVICFHKLHVMTKRLDMVQCLKNVD